jgi:hypothetical protein
VEGWGGGLTVSGVSRNRGDFVKCVTIQKRLGIPALGIGLISVCLFNFFIFDTVKGVLLSVIHCTHPYHCTPNFTNFSCSVSTFESYSRFYPILFVL